MKTCNQLGVFLFSLAALSATGCTMNRLVRGNAVVSNRQTVAGSVGTKYNAAVLSSQGDGNIVITVSRAHQGVINSFATASVWLEDDAGQRREAVAHRMEPPRAVSGSLVGTQITAGGSDRQRVYNSSGERSTVYVSPSAPQSVAQLPVWPCWWLSTNAYTFNPGLAKPGRVLTLVVRGANAVHRYQFALVAAQNR